MEYGKRPFSASRPLVSFGPERKLNNSARWLIPTIIHRSLLVRIETLGSEKQVSFTIDVDDTLPKSELINIRVTDSEIERSAVVIEAMGMTSSARISDTGRALVLLEACD